MAVGSSSFSPGEECTGLDCEAIAGYDRMVCRADSWKEYAQRSVQRRDQARTAHVISQGCKECRARVGQPQGKFSSYSVARAGRRDAGASATIAASRVGKIPRRGPMR